jgi:membrane protease subunit HflC
MRFAREEVAMNYKACILLLLLVLVVLAPTVVFTVDYTEYVYLTRFGRPMVTFDGADSKQAGLHFKWPWPIESVQRLDRRLQIFDLPPTELLTRDPKRNTIDRTLTLDAYVCWRIVDAPGVDRFIRSVGTPAGAQVILSQRLTSELGAAIGKMELDDLINLDPKKVDDTRIELRKRLLQGNETQGQTLEEMAKEEYGIEVVDVRLRRTNHPPAVREAIFERIRSERNKKRAEYESEGERLKNDIESGGARRVAELKAQAEFEAARLRSQAEAEADRIRNEAHSKDPQFYAFLKKLEEYQRILGDNKSMLLLSTHRELFDVLFHPPPLGNDRTNESHESKTQKRMGPNR